MRILSVLDAVIIVSASILFSEVSWWVLYSTKQVPKILNPQISQSLESAGTVTIGSLPSTLILPIVTYFPFWLMTFTVLKIIMNIEKRRRSLLI